MRKIDSRCGCCLFCCAVLSVVSYLCRVVKFWNEATQGAIAFEIDAGKDVYSITLPEGTFTNAEDIWNTLQGQKAIFNPAWAQYDHRVYLFPANMLRGSWFSDDRGACDCLSLVFIEPIH